MRWTSLVGGSFAFFVCLPAAVAADRSFAEPGALSVKVEKVPQSTTQLVSPTGPATARPLVVASHGFSASGDQQLGWAKHFASWGFLVAVPTFESPFSPDHQANAKVIEALVTKLGVGVKVGLEGHSAGGLSTALASANVKADAVVFFDPVDNADLGKTAVATLAAPSLGIFAAPSSCNAQAGWKAFATSTKGPALAFDVKGSTHCDGENAPRGLCALGCGGAASEQRQAAYAHYATAFLLAHLTGDAAAKAALAEADKDAELAGVVRSGTASVQPDASAPIGDASTSSSGGASSSSSSGAPNGAGPSSGESSGESVATDGAGGCATQGQTASRGAIFGLACLALGVLARRRRHARG